MSMYSEGTMDFLVPLRLPVIVDDWLAGDNIITQQWGKGRKQEPKAISWIYMYNVCVLCTGKKGIILCLEFGGKM